MPEPSDFPGNRAFTLLGRADKSRPTRIAEPVAN